MIRRDFFRFIGTGLVVGPAAVKAILATPVEAAPGGAFAWAAKPEWWVKEFDFGNKVGVCLGVLDSTTGQRVRQAVRLSHPRFEPGPREMDAFLIRVWEASKGGPLTSLPDPPPIIQAGQRILETWAETRWPPGVVGDGIMEGHEMGHEEET